MPTMRMSPEKLPTIRRRLGEDNHRLLREAATRSAVAAVDYLRLSINHDPGDMSWSHMMEIGERSEHLDAALEQLDSLGGPDDEYRSGGRLFHDTLAESRGNHDAAARLKRARAIGELRALGLGGSGDTFSPPLYEIGMFADIPRPERVFAGLLPTSPLPKGYEVFVPVLTASASVSTPAYVTPSTTWGADTAYALGATVSPTSPNGFVYRASTAGTSSTTTQPTWPTVLGETVTDGSVTWTCAAVSPQLQNVVPTETDPVDGYVTVGVSQQAGILTVSQQLFDQGWQQGHEDMATVTLTNAYDGDLETQLLAGSGSAGQVRGLVNTPGATTQTWTTTTPTAVALAEQIGAAIGAVATNRQKMPTAILMTPTRWAWLATGVDNQSRPLVNLNGDPRQPPATPTTPVGTVAGVPVYVTTGIPSNLGTGTNQDAVLVTRPEDHRLWTTPASLNVVEEQLATDLSVVITLHSSVAFMATRYPSATAIVTGTGLTTPVFA